MQTTKGDDVKKFSLARIDLSYLSVLFCRLRDSAKISS